MKNTAFRYRYRDGANNKVLRQEVFAGLSDMADLERIENALLPTGDLDDLGDFIPGQVGLKDLQNGFYEEHIALAEAMGSANLGEDANDADRAAAKPFDELRDSMAETKPIWWPDDHPLHTVVSIELTDAPVTVHKTIDEFIEELEATVWDDAYKPPFYDEMLANYDLHIAAETTAE